jgi:hypothetical protein
MLDRTVTPPSLAWPWSAGTLTDSDGANERHPGLRDFNRIANDCGSGKARRALGRS